MKLPTTLITVLTGLVLCPGIWAREGADAPNPRSQPAPPSQPQFKNAPDQAPKPPLEKYAFLGVATIPMDPVLRSHLNLDPGVGLIVQHVDPESASAGVLEQNDVLLYFRDQQLINHDQLAVLVRNAGIGAEVELTILRAGKSMKQNVVLGEREGMPPPDFRGFGQGGFQFSFPMPRERLRQEDKGAPKPEKSSAKPGATISVSAKSEGTASSSAPSPVTSSSTGEEIFKATWVDRDLVLQLTREGDESNLAVIRGGMRIFDGPVNTVEEQAAIPAEAVPAYQHLMNQLGK